MVIEVFGPAMCVLQGKAGGSTDTVALEAHGESPAPAQEPQHMQGERTDHPTWLLLLHLYQFVPIPVL